MNRLSCKTKMYRLSSILKRFDSLIIAFLGGVDSTFLLATAKNALGTKVVAVTAESPVHPRRDTDAAACLAKLLGVRHITLQSSEFGLPDFVANRKDRCYVCKKHVFSEIFDIAAEMRFSTVAHGANVDDLGDYRPGFKAAKELGVVALLVDAGLTKEDIRQLSQKMNLNTWNKPSMACLATRIPYDTPITCQALEMVEQAENFS